MRRHLYLIGMPGAGKSSVGEILSKEWNRLFVDLDQEIENGEGCSIANIFQQQGEAAFRRREENVLRELSQRKSPHIISTGGGVILSPTNRSRLKKTGFAIYLEVSTFEIISRLAAPKEREKRPLLQGDWEERLTVIRSVRDPFYQEVADWILCTDLLSPHEVANRIIQWECVFRELFGR